MKIRTKFSLMTAALIGAVVVSITAAMIGAQRKLLEEESELRLETLMEGVERLAREAVHNEDELMLLSYLMHLEKTRPELASADVTYRGHTSHVGSPRPGLLLKSRSVEKRVTVTYTVTAYPAPASQGPRLSVSTAGVSLNVPGNALVKIDSEAPPRKMTVVLGFIKEILDADISRALKPMMRRTIAIAGLFMGLGMLGALTISQLLTGPLTAMASAVTLVGRGRLDVKVDESRSDEIGVLGKSFNEMTERLKEHTQFREDILHTLTHELNTPLGGLKGYFELWRKRQLPEDPDERAQVLETMSAAILRMETSLGNALTLFRSSAGPVEGIKKLVWIDEIFDQVCVLFGPIARSKEISVHALALENVECLYAEEDLIRQVVTNLVSNALKYTASGGKIRLGLEGREGNILFWVADSGYGIRPEDIPNLFTKFYRTEGPGAGQRIPGTGLGLNIAQKAVSALGGRIWVESEFGKGSTFFVLLPKPRPAARKESSHE